MADLDDLDLDVSLCLRRVEFPELPLEQLKEQLKVAYASLHFLADFGNGRRHGVRLDGYPIIGVARDAIRVLWTECQPGGHYRSPGGAEDAIQSLRRFADFHLAARLGRTVRRLTDITASHFDEFERYLWGRYGRHHFIPYRRLSTLRMFLELAHEHHLVDPAVLPRLSYVSQEYGAAGEPKRREPYSPFIASQLRSASLKGIEDAVTRLTTVGPQIAASGRDPRMNGWDSAPNILWEIVNRRVVSRYSLPKNIQNTFTISSDMENGYTFSDLIRLIHCDSDDILCFVIYISLTTGIPVESIVELRDDCLSNESNGYIDIAYVKRRRGEQALSHKRIRSAEADSPGAIVKVAKRLTRFTREMAPNDVSSWLLIGHTRSTTGNFIRPFRNFNPEISRFCLAHGIKDDRCEPMTRFTPARLRKTYKAESYLKKNGNLADVADDHGKYIHARHYANVESLRGLHEATIAQGLSKALEIAYVPICLDAEAERRLEASPGSEAARMGISISQAERVRSGQNEVWLASCLDEKNLAEENAEGVCATPVWGCLECRNAVITSSKLPAVLCFLDHILERRQQMNLGAWIDRYGRAYVLIREYILPRFPNRDVDMARAIAEADSDLLWLPAELTMSH